MTTELVDTAYCPCESMKLFRMSPKKNDEVMLKETPTPPPDEDRGRIGPRSSSGAGVGVERIWTPELRDADLRVGALRE